MSEPSAPPPIPAAPPVRGDIPPHRSRGRTRWALLLLACFIGGSCLVLVFLTARFVHRGGYHPAGTGRAGAMELSEITLEDNASKEKIAIVDVQGVISGESPGGHPSLVESIQDQLQRIEEDDAVRAVILRVDSPGGEVLASDEIHNALRSFQTNNDIPVVVSMGSLAASGGYYVSAPCRWIVAHPLTLTGSIGVIFHGYNYRALMDKVGIRPDVVKSGKLKDMFSGELRPEDELPEEKAILKGLVSESFNRFKQVIREGRAWAARENQSQQVSDGRTLASNWEDFADGRILSGNQALELGLVDELGSFDTAVERAEILAGIENANLITYQSPPRLSDWLQFLGKSESGRIQVEVNGLNPMSALPQGRLYFLSPLHLR